MALIEVRDIYKSYSECAGVKTPALSGINIVLEKGDFACIAGPSGSGKTTLLNLIGALDKPDSGKIYYEGSDITGIAINRLAEFRLRHVGFIFQAYNLINTLTAFENVEYVMLLQRKELQERRKRSEEILERVGLKELMHKRVNCMSGGQQQRVAVARAIAAEPKIILADEPTANLDSLTASKLVDLMKELNRERQMTFLFSTHDSMVIGKAGKVFQIRDGRIIT